MKKRSLAGNFGVGVFVIAFFTIAIAFATPNWLVSDYRITGAKLDRLGLWVHCFRSLPDVNDDYQRRFFVGCRWVFDPFTKGYDEIRGYLVPRKRDYQLFRLSINTNIHFFLFDSLHDCNTIFLHISIHWYTRKHNWCFIVLFMLWS